MLPLPDQNQGGGLLSHSVPARAREKKQKAEVTPGKEEVKLSFFGR